ncbi:uncharacterized protein LOC143896450 [Temnothorax americanus]|uniref:uncharacterized protein LOC143896450 n=1 Tax=Temnothorax americanus TaxID=1964332 RepID=UPI004068BF80
MSAENRRLVEELHAPARKNFPRRRVVVRGYDDLWQADVVEMRPYSRQNAGNNYILTVIDVLSKYAWAIPLKTKSGKEVATTLRKIFREDARCPENLQTDKGKEFYNADVRKIAAPARFRVDDPVRVSKFKTIFEKGYTPNWTTEIFRIARVQRTNPVTYLLKDIRGEAIAGGFYEHELLRVSDPDVYLVEKVLRKRGNQVYVKWLGMDSSHNSWIDKTSVL